MFLAVRSLHQVKRELTMQMRGLIAILNGALVLMLYAAAWGAPSFTIASLEGAFAVAAAIVTWFALRRPERTPTLDQVPA